MRRISKMNTALACLGLFAASLSGLPSYCQSGVDLGQGDLIRQLREAGNVMKEYGSNHDHYPNTTDEMDSCLKNLYSKVNMTDPDTTVQVSSNGKYRTFYQFAMAIDPSYKSVPIINGVPQVPSSMNMPANTIVIMSDGADEIAGWAAGIDGKPISVDQGKGPMYFYNKLTTKEKN